VSKAGGVTSDARGSSSRFWVIFLAATTFAIGLLYFLSQLQRPQPSEVNVAKVAQNPDTGVSVPAAKEPQPFPMKADQEKAAPKTEGESPFEATADIQQHIARLRGGSNEQKVTAVEALASRGEAASLATRALCEATINPAKEVSRSALQALEKVAPQIHEPVFTLVVDGEYVNHRKAISALRRLKGQAKPAMPVLLFEVKKCLVDLDAAVRGVPGSVNWGGITLVDVINDILNGICEIAPEDPEGLAIIIDAGRVILRHRIRPTSGRATDVPFRSTAISLLGTIAEKHSEHRKTIFPQLSSFLNVGMKQLARHSTDPETKNQRVIISEDLAQIEAISVALQKCGPEANGLLMKTVVPALMELEFNENASIRSMAKQIRKQME
jgi:hypothetical protein